MREFTKLEICHLGPDYSDDESPKKRWEMTQQNGSWRKRVNAGGCRNYLGNQLIPVEFAVRQKTPVLIDVSKYIFCLESSYSKNL